MNSHATFDQSINSGLQVGQNVGRLEFHTHHGPSDELQNQACLRDLRITNPRDDKARIESFKGGLLHDLYGWILEDEAFERWRYTSEGNPKDRLLWIRADPGKGKTMLLCGIIDELEATLPDNTIIAYFFCQASDPRLNNATAVLRGLIFLLWGERPDLVSSHVRPRYDKEGRALFEDTNAWNALAEIFVKVLEDPRLPCIMLVLDALDECTDLVRLLELVRRSAASPRVKWIVSSRNWPIIEKHLTASYCSALSLEWNEHFVARAVRSYIHTKVDLLAQQNNYDESIYNFTISYLMENSDNTFLWVALVCDLLSEAHASQVARLLTTFPASLDGLYQRMIGEIQTSSNAALCRRILATVLTVYRPLTIEELPILVGILPQPRPSEEGRQVREMIKLCGSFLTLRGDTIFFVHHSAKDFLLRCRVVLPSGIESEHLAIVDHSIDGMTQILRCNIYDIEYPGCQLEQVSIPSPDPLARICYSCVYWIDHLLACGGNGPTGLPYSGRVQWFFEHKLLHWLEALSLLENLSEVLGRLDQMETVLQSSPMATPLSKLVTDIGRFLRLHQPGIEASPLQVYSSALIFTPRQSLIRDLYRAERASWIMGEPGCAEQWNSCLHTVEIDANEFRGIDWSPNGARVVAAREGLTVSSWNARNGQCVETIQLEEELGRTGLDLAVFSNGRLAASHSYWDEGGHTKIWIWDIATGKCSWNKVVEEASDGKELDKMQWLDNGGMLALRFQSEGKIWNLNDGTDRTCSPGDDSMFTEILCWSPDGSRFAKFGLRWLRICDGITGSTIQVFNCGKKGVFEAAWSPDGSMLATTTAMSVRIWTVATGKLLRELETGREASGWRIAWSNDGDRIACTGQSGRVEVWSARTGECFLNLDGLITGTRMLAWAPDGNRLVTCGAYEFRIWDTSNTSPVGNPLKVEKEPNPPPPPPPPRRSIFRSFLSSIKSRGTGTGARISRKGQKMKGPNGKAVTAVYWSPDGSRLASFIRDYEQDPASPSEEILIWNARTGFPVCALRGLFGAMDTIAWSPDGRLGTCDGITISTWDIDSGTRLMRFHDEMFETRDRFPPEAGDLCWSWSPEGRRIAAASIRTDDIRVWDTASGKRVQTLAHPEIGVNVLAWSHNGRWLAGKPGESESPAIIVWDCHSGAIIKAINGPATTDLDDHTARASMSGLIWSTSDDRIASTFSDGALIFDVTTGDHLGTLVYPPWDYISEREFGNSTIFEIWDLIVSPCPSPVEPLMKTVKVEAFEQTRVHTNLGVFDLPPHCDEYGRRRTTVSHSEYSLSSDGAWITWKGHNLLWLPWDYRCTSYTSETFAALGTAVAVGCVSGSALVITFAENPF